MNKLDISQKKCRILYLVGQLGPGGLERQLYYLLQTMDRQRYSPVVVVWNYQADAMYVRLIQDLGVQVLALPKTRGRVAQLLAFRQLVKLIKPEVVHSYSFYTNFGAYIGGLATSSVAIGSIRGDFIRSKKDSGALLGKLSARWPRTQIYNNVVAAESMRRVGGLFKPNRVVVVRNALDLKKFKKVESPVQTKAKIIGVGSLLPIKRWDRLIKAACDLRRNGQEFQLRIVGDGPLRLSLEKQVQNLRLNEQVMFLGHRNDIPELLAESYCLVHTSDAEGCPNVVLEAMACGRAVVATDVGDVSFLIDDGKTGFVVDRDDHLMLTLRLGMLITDITLCRRMGAAGRAKAEKEFGLDRLISETFGAYAAAGWKDC